MPKASVRLANGTYVQIEGSTEEVRALLEIYSGAERAGGRPPIESEIKTVPGGVASKHNADQPELAKIVELIKNCDEAEAIERRILDRSSQIDRTLLPLYMVYEHLKNAFGLSSGEINRITNELGVPVSVHNVSTTLATTAARYVIGDKVRVKGQAVRYKLSRRGVQYLKNVISGKSDANQSAIR